MERFRSIKEAFNKGVSAMKIGDHKKACTFFKKVTETDNRLQTDAHYNLAICLLQMKEFGLAAKHYKITCTRDPAVASPEMLEFISVLERATNLPLEQAESLVNDFELRAIEQQRFLKIGEQRIAIEDCARRIDNIVQSKRWETKLLFDDINRSLSAVIPMRVYSVPVLKDVAPGDAFGFCDAFILYGATAAIVLVEYTENRKIDLLFPPYSKPHDRLNLSRRCPFQWLFAETLLDTIIKTHAQHFVAQKPWVRNSLGLIRSHLIKEFVYRGFSIGLESAGY